jgi:hypothetical protein
MFCDTGPALPRRFIIIMNYTLLFLCSGRVALALRSEQGHTSQRALFFILSLLTLTPPAPLRKKEPQNVRKGRINEDEINCEGLGESDNILYVLYYNIMRSYGFSSEPRVPSHLNHVLSAGRHAGKWRKALLENKNVSSPTSYRYGGVKLT